MGLLGGGFFEGGVTAGGAKARAYEMEKRKLELAERQAALQEQQQTQAMVADTLKRNAEQLQGIIAAAKDARAQGASPEQLAPLRQMIAIQAASLGVPVEGMPHAPIQVPGADHLVSTAMMRFDAEVGAVVDPATKARQEALGKVEGARVIAGEIGIPETQAFQQAGLAPAPNLPAGFRINPETGHAEPIPGFISSQARLSAATRAPEKPGPIIVLEGPNGERIPLRQDSPHVDALMAEGWLPQQPEGARRLLRAVNPETGEVFTATFSNRTGQLVMRKDGQEVPVPENFVVTGLGSGDAEEIEMTPGGGIQIRRGAAGTTAATQSRFEQRQAEFEDVVLRVRDLIDRIQASDVGLRGVIGEAVFDEMLGQFSSAFVDQDRVANRQLMRSIREAALRLMATDERFSDRDRAAISTMFPSDGVFESETSAVTKLEMLSDIMRDRADIFAGRLSRKAITEMTPEEIREAFQKGQINERTARRALHLIHGFPIQ